MDLNGYLKVVRRFYEKLERTNQKEKVIKRKRNNLYVKWVGSDNSFNSQINKKYLIEQNSLA